MFPRPPETGSKRCSIAYVERVAVQRLLAKMSFLLTLQSRSVPQLLIGALALFCFSVKAMSGYELTMTIIEGGINYPTTSSKLFYVETAIGGVRVEDDNTDLAKSSGGKVIWNKVIKKSFQTLEPKTPIMVSLTLYKKKTFLSGFRLVGTAHYCLADLVRILNKPAVTGKIPLNTKNYHFASGNLVLQLQLRSKDVSATDCNACSPRSLPAVFATTLSSQNMDGGADVEAVHTSFSKRERGATAHRVDLVAENTKSVVPAAPMLFKLYSLKPSLAHVFIAVAMVTLFVCVTVQLIVIT